jgi:hypothetical protein
MMSGPESVSSRVASIEDLAALMRADGVQLQVDVEHHRLQAANVIAGEGAPLLVDWDSGRGAAQVIQALPWPIPEERLGDAALAMVRANHESILPGFGLNTATRLAYCRGVIPLSLGSADVGVVRALISTVTRMAREQGPGVASAWRASA